MRQALWRSPAHLTSVITEAGAASKERLTEENPMATKQLIKPDLPSQPYPPFYVVCMVEVALSTQELAFHFLYGPSGVEALSS